jgi:thioesterase DpgC
MLTTAGLLAEDAATLAATVHAGEARLATLPAKPERDPGQQAEAERIGADLRHARTAFLARHCEAVYAELTADRSVHMRLAELVYAAAERFPGLVPTREQIAAERTHRQADKEGREIDQAILVHWFLRSPVAGPHLMSAMRRPDPRSTDLLGRFRRDKQVTVGAVAVERVGSAAHVTIHNGYCLNAEDDALIASLEVAVDLVLLDDDVRVGVLRGGPMSHPRYHGRRVFSAGINLKHLRAGQISFVDFLLGRELGYLNKILRGIQLDGQTVAHTVAHTVAKPWVAAVDSFAIGGGLQLLLVVDWVVAANDAYFSLPAAKEGIVPGAANLRLTRLTGSRLARRIILGGHRILATDPEASLVCDEVVAPEAMDAAVEAAAARLANPAVVANRQALILAEEPEESLRAYLAEFALMQAGRLYDRDVLDNLG